MDPFQLFHSWYKKELEQTDLRMPSTCCLSTMGLDGYPNARSLSLKDLRDECFILTGSLASLKAREIGQSNKVSLHFWWPSTEKQVRIQGNATEIPDAASDYYFSEKNRDAQIVSVVSEQGKEISNLEILSRKYGEVEMLQRGMIIEKPADWGGFSIAPVRIEFMEYRSSHFHIRTLYELKNGNWSMKMLQP